MKKIKITVMKKARYDDLIEKYENPIQHACDLQEGQEFICEGWQKPDGFCGSAWESVSPFVMTLAHGGENFLVIGLNCGILIPCFPLKSGGKVMLKQEIRSDPCGLQHSIGSGHRSRLPPCHVRRGDLPCGGKH